MDSLPNAITTSEVTIAVVVSDIAHDFVSLAGALTTTPHFSAQVAPTAFDDEFSRYKLWAGNIAAHQKGRRSLEYRLRDAAHLKTETHNLLGALGDALRNALAIVKGEKTPWDQLSNPGSETDDSDSDDSFRETTELQQLFESTKTIITSLFRLSMSIRDPASDSQSKSTISMDKSFYEQHDIQHVREKFPDSPTYLTERLGRAISARRQYLSYRAEHHRKLAKNIEKMGFEKPTTQFTTNSTEATPLPGLDRSNSLNVLDREDDTASQTSYATSVNAAIRVPTLPKEAQTQEFFECPFCFLLVSIHSTAGWKQHVYRDLHPYCCTYEHCTIADRLYDSRKTWFAHELEAHRTSWQCVEGCAKLFSTEDLFQDHVQKAHPELALKDMFAALKKTSGKRASSTEQEQCKLCGKHMSIRMLQKHLGGHQQQLALFAVPPNLDDTEDDPNEDQGSMDVGNNSDEEISDVSETSDAEENDDARDRTISAEYDDEQSALRQIQSIREKWDNKIRMLCDVIIAEDHGRESQENMFIYVDNMIRVNIEVALENLKLASNTSSHVRLRGFELVEEVKTARHRMLTAMEQYRATRDDINSSTLQSSLLRSLEGPSHDTVPHITTAAGDDLSEEDSHTQEPRPFQPDEITQEYREDDISQPSTFQGFARDLNSIASPPWTSLPPSGPDLEEENLVSIAERLLITKVKEESGLDPKEEEMLREVETLLIREAMKVATKEEAARNAAKRAKFHNLESLLVAQQQTHIKREAAERKAAEKAAAEKKATKDIVKPGQDRIEQATGSNKPERQKSAAILDALVDKYRRELVRSDQYLANLPKDKDIRFRECNSLANSLEELGSKIHALEVDEQQSPRQQLDTIRQEIDMEVKLREMMRKILLASRIPEESRTLGSEDGMTLNLQRPSSTFADEDEKKVSDERDENSHDNRLSRGADAANSLHDRSSRGKGRQPELVRDAMDPEIQSSASRPGLDNKTPENSQDSDPRYINSEFGKNVHEELSAIEYEYDTDDSLDQGTNVAALGLEEQKKRLLESGFTKSQTQGLVDNDGSTKAVRFEWVKPEPKEGTVLEGPESGNEIRLRVDASAPLSLSFNGDMEGRTLHLVPVENGMADIVIGGARGESTYHDSESDSDLERGSVMGNRQKARTATNRARRDAEEMTERSSRSVLRRRDDGERNT